MKKTVSLRLPNQGRLFAWVAWIFIAGLSLWVFAWTLTYTRQFAINPPVRVAEGLGALGWSKEGFFWFTAIFLTIQFLVFLVVSVAVLLLRGHERMALLTSIFLITFGSANSFPEAAEYLALIEKATYFYRIPFFITSVLAFGLFPVFLGMFPNGRLAPRWMRYIVISVFLYTLAWNLFPQTIGSYQGPVGMISLSTVVLMFGGSIYAQVWRYQNYSTPLERQQTKWFIFGVVVTFFTFILPPLLFNSQLNLDTSGSKATVLYDLIVTVSNTLSNLLIPITIGIAILRYRLWDIDILIRRTLQYSLVTVLLGLVYFVGVTLLQSLFTAVSGQESPVATVLSTLAMAALFSPLRSLVQSFIDRRFFRSKYDSEQALALFADISRDEVEINRLISAVLKVVDETVKPEKASIWLKAGERK